MPYEPVNVECYSGYRANERPMSFTFKGRRWEVEEIMERWYEGGLIAGGPALHYFKVHTTEGRVFLLCYNTVADAWAIWTPPVTTH